MLNNLILQTCEKKYFLLICFFWITNTIYTQELGKAQIFVSPTNTIIKIDDKLLNMAKLGQGHTIELSVGEHILQLWAEKMAIHTDTITIVADSTINYRKGLNKIDPEYQAFRNAHDQYFRHKMVNVGIITADVGLTTFFYSY